MKPLLHPTTMTQVQAVTAVQAAGYIFHGQRGTGKYTSALWLARRLNCAAGGTDNCVRCRQIDAGNYPDLITIAPAERPSISIDQIRGLLGKLALAPLQAGGQRVVIIDEAHQLTVEAQNALLKSLEEPPPNTRFIVVTDALEELLPTVRSRLAAIYFAPAATSDIAALLQARAGLDTAAATKLATLAAGSPGLALELALNAERAASYSHLAELCQAALTRSLFGRLQLARQIADEKIPLVEFLGLLHRSILSGITGGGEVTAGRIGAVATCRRLLGTVTPRVALDRLMLELA